MIGIQSAANCLCGAIQLSNNGPAIIEQELVYLVEHDDGRREVSAFEKLLPPK